MSETDNTISRDQFKWLCEHLLKEAPAILKGRDTSDKAMSERSALLRELYIRLQEELGIKPVTKTLTTRGFETYEFSYAEAIFELALERATRRFNYQAIVERFLDQATAS